MRLIQFLQAVHTELGSTLAEPDFHESQRVLLEGTLRVYMENSLSNPQGDPLALLFLGVRAWNAPIDPQVIHVGAFCALYLLSADLMDDVQDEDLAGKPHEHAGPAIAFNSSVTLLLLGLQELRLAIELEPDVERRISLLRVFNRTSLLAVLGQHRDLMGAAGAFTPDDVLQMQKEKTSSVAMIMEMGGLLAHLDEPMLEQYRLFGESLSQFIQIRDDIRDCFGKSSSPDLVMNRVSFPVACLFAFAHHAEVARFQALTKELPGTLEEIRALLYQSGAIAHSASAMEEHRERMHMALARTKNSSSFHRCLLDIIDNLAESIYSPPSLDCTRSFFEPEGAWHDRVRQQRECFLLRMRALGEPGTPALRPWHLPQWMYDSNKDVIYYPDIEGLADEVLPEQANLLGIRDLVEVSRIQWEQAPALLAHEMFHCWRRSGGRLTQDYWHEEWAANTLTVAYAEEYEPVALEASVALARRVALQGRGLADDGLRGLLLNCEEPRPQPHDGGGVPLRTMLLMTCDMILGIVARQPLLRQSVTKLLAPPANARGVAAA